MAKKKKNKKTEVQDPKTVSRQPANANPDKRRYLFAAAVVIITLICYSPALSDQKTFTNWDDPGYVLDQPLTKDKSKDIVSRLFKPETQVMLNYHPLTMLTLRWNYESGFDKKNKQLSISPFIWTNIILHLLNTFLVFVFLYVLSGNRIWVASFAALWFGIHPMHVESVAWVSERKDVLYCFFFLLSCLAYLRFLKTSNYLFFALCFLAFLLSCLSKAMAVPLPLVLILLDIYHQRKLSLKPLLEKIPFFILAAWIGWNAVQIQQQGAIADFEVFTLFQRVMFASYGFVMYWVKLFAPFGISAFYPYPNLDAGGSIPAVFYLAPALALLIAAVPLIWAWKKNKELFRVNLFGMGFFIVMVALVLQFLSVGAAIMADRYTYLPYIGGFFLVLMGIDLRFNVRDSKLWLAGLASFSLVLAVITFNRIPVWDNSGALWTDVIEKYPYVLEQKGNVIKVKEKGFETAYKNRGNWFADQQMYDSAFADYLVLTKAGTRDAGVWSNIGNVYALKKDMPNALNAYSKAIELDANNHQTYLNRGLTYSNMGRYAEALADMDKVIKLVPNLEQAHALRTLSLLNLGKFQETIEASTILLNTYPNNPEIWFYRGTAYVNLNQPQPGVNDLLKAIQLNPNSAAYFYNLAFAYSKLGDKQQALGYAMQAKKMGYNVSEEFIDSLR